MVNAEEQVRKIVKVQRRQPAKEEKLIDEETGQELEFEGDSVEEDFIEEDVV